MTRTENDGYLTSREWRINFTFGFDATIHHYQWLQCRLPNNAILHRCYGFYYVTTLLWRHIIVTAVRYQVSMAVASAGMAGIGTTVSHVISPLR